MVWYDIHLDETIFILDDYNTKQIHAFKSRRPHLVKIHYSLFWRKDRFVSWQVLKHIVEGIAGVRNVVLNLLAETWIIPRIPNHTSTSEQSQAKKLPEKSPSTPGHHKWKHKYMSHNKLQAELLKQQKHFTYQEITWQILYNVVPVI